MKNLKDLSSFSDADKIKVFDKLYKICRSDIEDVIKHGSTQKDAENAAWESIMTLMLGKKVFGVWEEYIHQ